jgi:hypothetical protein
MSVSANDSLVDKLLGSGRLKLQETIHANLESLLANDTREVVLKDLNLVPWCNDRSDQRLAIFGEMGCGKTCAMAFLINELKKGSGGQLPRLSVCYYYCDYRKTEKAIQITQTLVLSLLRQFPEQKDEFHRWHKHYLDEGEFGPETSMEKLETFLKSILKKVDGLLFIVIDGFNECDCESRYALCKLFRTLCDESVQVKIALSSLPEEEIFTYLKFEKYLPVTMKLDTKGDDIVASHTVQARLSRLKIEVREHIENKLSLEARGSAMWTETMVGEIADKELSKLEDVQTHLTRSPVPRELHEYYQTVLARVTHDDDENCKTSLEALKILAVAYRSLSIQEIGWAVELSRADKNCKKRYDLSRSVDPEMVMALIHPFVSSVDYTDKNKYQVQLLHQSVRDFVLSHFPRNNPQVSMLKVCVRYLLLDDVDPTGLFPKTHLAFEDLPQYVDVSEDQETFDYYQKCTWSEWKANLIQCAPRKPGFDEFFAYASSYWQEHLSAVSGDNRILVCMDDTGLFSVFIPMSNRGWILRKHVVADERGILELVQASIGLSP